MVFFVFASDSHQDSNGVIVRRLFDPNGLQAALQCWVPLNVFTVVVQSGGPDALNLTAGQRRLKDVRGVYGAFSGARTDYRVNLVDEENAIAGGLDFFDYLLQSFFKLASVLGPGDQSAHI